MGREPYGREIEDEPAAKAGQSSGERVAADPTEPAPDPGGLGGADELGAWSALATRPGWRDQPADWDEADFSDTLLDDRMPEEDDIFEFTEGGVDAVVGAQGSSPSQASLRRDGARQAAEDLARQEKFGTVSPLRIFLCHSTGDKVLVRKLRKRLRHDGYNPWLDEEDLLPGQDWELEIKRAVRRCDIILVCLSRESVTKRGFVQREIAFALDVAAEQPEGQIFLIPARLQPCDVPERLQHRHWVDLFRRDGYTRLRSALNAASRSLRG